MTFPVGFIWGVATSVTLILTLDLKAYRFSISWARVLPEGRGRITPAGLDYDT